MNTELLVVQMIEPLQSPGFRIIYTEETCTHTSIIKFIIPDYLKLEVKLNEI